MQEKLVDLWCILDCQALNYGISNSIKSCPSSMPSPVTCFAESTPLFSESVEKQAAQLVSVYSGQIVRLGKLSAAMGIGLWAEELTMPKRNMVAVITHALCLHCKVVFSCARFVKVPTCVLKIHEFFIFSMAKSPGACC